MLVWIIKIYRWTFIIRKAPNLYGKQIIYLFSMSHRNGIADESCKNMSGFTIPDVARFFRMRAVLGSEKDPAVPAVLAVLATR